MDVVEKTEAKASGSSGMAFQTSKVAKNMLPSDIEVWFEWGYLGFVAACATKEAQVAVARPINVEEAKHVVDKTHLEATGTPLQTFKLSFSYIGWVLKPQK